MGDVVNLRQARKQRARADKDKKAAENRVRFGRTKAERTRDAQQRSKAVEHVGWTLSTVRPRARTRERSGRA